MCASCDDIDRRIQQYRGLLPLTLQPSERDHINRLIQQLRKDRARLHENPRS